MLHYNKIDVSERIDPTKSNRSKECMICHFLFFNHEFRFRDSVCNGCHDLTILCLNLSNIAIITVKDVDDHCIIHNSKSETNSLLKHCVLDGRGYI